MFLAITNTPRPYAWGSASAIANLLGTTPSGGPEAELWLGAHPGSPSVIVDPTRAGGASTLAEWIAADPGTALGRFADAGRLPFLLKILAAAHPLSLQAHPTIEQARAGFARENALGIPVDAADRNYKDAFPKPELIFALSPTFDALCGFRPLAEVRDLLELLLSLDAQTEDPQPQPLEDLLDFLFGPSSSSSSPDVSLRAVFEWLISSGSGVPTLVSLVTRLAPLSADPSLATAAALAAEYPDDPGIVISLLLNRVTLARGEALYLPSGNIHAYLDGLGVELMAASDNVLRGGLTPKHIDVPELVSVLDFTPVPVPYLRAVVPGSGASAGSAAPPAAPASATPDVPAAPDSAASAASPTSPTSAASAASPTSPTSGVEVFVPDVPDFVLVRVSGTDLDASFTLT